MGTVVFGARVVRVDWFFFVRVMFGDLGARLVLKGGPGRLAVFGSGHGESPWGTVGVCVA